MGDVTNQMVVVECTEVEIVQWKLKLMGRKWGVVKSKSREKTYWFSWEVNIMEPGVE